MGKRKGQSYSKICPICGKRFRTDKDLTKYCSRECYRVSVNRRKGIAKEKKVEAEKNHNQLFQLAKEAQVAGLSYGQYVARMEGR